MRRGTTPTYIMTFQTGVGAQIEEIILTFKQNYGASLSLYLSKQQIALNGDVATCTLTQEQTLAFRNGKLTRQLKVKFLDDVVQTTDVVEEVTSDDLHGKVI